MFDESELSITLEKLLNLVTDLDKMSKYCLLWRGCGLSQTFATIVAIFCHVPTVNMKAIFAVMNTTWAVVKYMTFIYLPSFTFLPFCHIIFSVGSDLYY